MRWDRFASGYDLIAQNVAGVEGGAKVQELSCSKRGDFLCPAFVDVSCTAGLKIDVSWRAVKESMGRIDG